MQELKLSLNMSCTDMFDKGVAQHSRIIACSVPCLQRPGILPADP